MFRETGKFLPMLLAISQKAGVVSDATLESGCTASLQGFAAAGALS